jgi:hypothetical protein
MPCNTGGGGADTVCGRYSIEPRLPVLFIGSSVMYELDSSYRHNVTELASLPYRAKLTAVPCLLGPKGSGAPVCAHMQAGMGCSV